MTLPDFLICGAEKAGTTALFNFLKEHPEIGVSTEKELHFFTTNYGKGVEWYENKFKHTKGKKSVGEASPSYMYHPAVPERIHNLIPDARLIFILRHPVDRAYSQYWHEVNRSGREKLSFEEAIERAFGAGKGRVSEDMDRIRLSYLERGRYAEAIERFEEVFPKKKILILIHRDLKERPEEVLKEVFGFLGVDDSFVSDKWREKHNVGITPKSKTVDRIVKKVIFDNRTGLKFKFFMENHMSSVWKFFGRALYREGYPPMKKSTRKMLIDYYRPYNEEVESMLGRKLDWWYK